MLSESDDDGCNLPTITKSKLRKISFRKRITKPATISKAPVSPSSSDDETINKQEVNVTNRSLPVRRKQEEAVSSVVSSSDSDLSSNKNSPIIEIQSSPLSVEESELHRPVQVDYYHGDKSLPVYKRGMKHGIPTKDFVNDILFTTKEKIRSVPLSVDSNVSFLVDIGSLGHPKDLLCDACGVWTQTNTKKKFFNVLDGHIIESSISEHFGRINTIKVTRLSYINSAATDFHRIVLFISHYDEYQELKSYAACQYFFEGPERMIQPKSHASSKSGKIYHRTFESTKDIIKKNANSKKAKQIVHDILEEKGGVQEIKAPGEHARNRKQVNNYVYNQKSKETDDPLLELMYMCKSQAREISSAFVREVIASPELKIFMATNQQLLDIERFCLNPESFSVLGVDATYNVGDFYLTLTTYRNLIFSNNKGRAPVFIGPALIHQKKLFDSYFTLPSMMIEYKPSLQRVLVYGSDGERNLCEAMDTSFCFATHLLCDIHMKDNIVHKLTELGIRNQTSKAFLRDIFGHQRGEEKTPGLVDCYSAEAFDTKLESLKSVWEERDPNGAKFFEYFLTYKADYIKNTMTANVREMAGLGYPPKVYNQNANECANSVIKRDLNFKKLNIKEAVVHLQQIINRQFEQCRLSMIGRGEWRVKDIYKDLEIMEENYYRMTPTQKRKAEEKMFTCETRDEAKTPQPPNTSERSSIHLSVKPSDSQMISIPYQIVEEMFQKADRLVTDQSNIVHAPGSSGKVHLVLSCTSSEQPHQVRTIGSNGQLACDKNCIRWVTHKICAHTIAVAETKNQLRKFLNWFNNSTRKPNFTALANMDMPQGRGKKATKATQRRKGSSTETPEPINFTTENQRTPSENNKPAPHKPAKPNPSPKPALPNPTPGSYQLTLLRFCHEKTSTCYGCKGGLKPSGIPPPPEDFVVVTKGQRQFTRNDGTPLTKLGNMYFHFNEACIRKYNSYYLSCLLKVPEDVKPHLLDVHRDYLRGLNIPV